MHLWKYNFEIQCVQFLRPLIGQKNWMKTTEKSLDRTPFFSSWGALITITRWEHSLNKQRKLSAFLFDFIWVSMMTCNPMFSLQLTDTSIFFDTSNITICSHQSVVHDKQINLSDLRGLVSLNP